MIYAIAALTFIAVTIALCAIGLSFRTLRAHPKGGTIDASTTTAPAHERDLVSLYQPDPYERIQRLDKAFREIRGALEIKGFSIQVHDPLDLSSDIPEPPTIGEIVAMLLRREGLSLGYKPGTEGEWVLDGPDLPPITTNVDLRWAMSPDKIAEVVNDSVEAAIARIKTRRSPKKRTTKKKASKRT